MPDSPHHTWLGSMVKALRFLIERSPDAVTRIEDLQQQLLALSMLDLEPARDLLMAGYCPRQGGKNPRDPIPMFRSLILMLLLGKPAYNQWVKYLKGHPEVAILSGFLDPHFSFEHASLHDLCAAIDCPGVGTYYDFAARLLDGPYQKPCDHIVRPSQRLRGSKGQFRRDLQQEKEHRHLLQEQQLAEKNERKVQQMVRIALEQAEQQLPADFLNRIEELLMVCAVVPSAQTGFLGDLSKLTISGDGSALASHASGRGKRMCDCREQQIYNCDCPKTYSDPEATWGWDSADETTCFGHRLHLVQIFVNGVDLPLHVMVEAAHTADVVMGVESLSRLYKLLRKHLPHAKIEFSLYDKGYDAEHFYRLNHALGIAPLIPLSNQSKTPVDVNNIARDEHGTPLCAGNIPMKRMGCNNQRGHVRYCCPAKYVGRDKRRELERCPLGAWCEPESKMGPLVYLPFEENPRLNTVVPRGSEQFKERFKQRSGPERFNSTLVSSGLKGRPYRRQHLFHLGGLCHAIGRHAKAWAKKRFGAEKAKDANELLDWVESLLVEKRAEAHLAEVT